jgi:hypothetical protein
MKKNGGPAFPQNDASVNRINNLDGMTLRDYFAGQALVGIMANSRIDTEKENRFYAVLAFDYADEMIKARD